MWYPIAISNIRSILYRYNLIKAATSFMRMCTDVVSIHAGERLEGEVHVSAQRVRCIMGVR